MGFAKLSVFGNDYIGAFATVTERHVFFGDRISERNKAALAESLGVEPVSTTVFGTDLVGIFSRANSNGILISSMAEDREVEALKALRLGINITVLDSSLNAIGNNILANDKIAVVNPDYDSRAVAAIGDTLGVEVVKRQIGGFKTLGANNILTNSGFVINNRATDEDKASLDEIVGYESVRSTANMGSLSIGLAVVANSKGLAFGGGTTGYEIARIMEALGMGGDSGIHKKETSEVSETGG